MVDNEPGVLARVVGLFSGRGYNIESLSVSEVDSHKFLSIEDLRSDNPAELLESPKTGRKLPDTLSVEEINSLIYKYLGNNTLKNIKIIHIVGPNNFDNSKKFENYKQIEFIKDMTDFYSSIDQLKFYLRLMIQHFCTNFAFLVYCLVGLLVD